MLNSFAEIYDLGSKVVGAKAYNVAKCNTVIGGESGVFVPSSLVLTKQEVSSFYNNTSKRSELLKAIKDSFGDNRIIVRSSSVYEDSKFFSAAGKYETCMNLYETSDIINAVLMVRNSASTNSARLYNGLYLDNCQNGDEEMAVLIQEMIPCDYSGILYTSNPLSKNEEMLVEFTDGLGDKVASGEKTSETYLLDTLIVSSDNNLECINGELKCQLEKLKRVANKLIKDFESQLDIEWGICKSRLYIFQVRPMFYCHSETSGIYNLDLVSHTYAIKGRTVSHGIFIGKTEDYFITSNMKQVEVGHIVKYGGFLIKEGGLLSHAASLTRELGRPCIIVDNNMIQQKETYILDGYKGELIPWSRLSFYEKGVYLWEAFYHIAKNVNNNLLHIAGITKIKVEHKYEAVVVGSDLLYKQTDNYDCYDQYSTTYDIDGDELINYNIIVRKQQTGDYIRLQVKHINLSKQKYREDQEILFYFENEDQLERFVQQFPLHSTGKQHRKVLRFNFDNYSVNLIKWLNNKSYITVDSVSEDSLIEFCEEIKKTPEILFCKSGKEIFDELEIKLDFNI